MDRHLVISSDCHAGLPPERYRDYLDPAHREVFDAARPIQHDRCQEDQPEEQLDPEIADLQQQQAVLQHTDQ